MFYEAKGRVYSSSFYKQRGRFLQLIAVCDQYNEVWLHIGRLTSYTVEVILTIREKVTGKAVEEEKEKERERD